MYMLPLHSAAEFKHSFLTSKDASAAFDWHFLLYPCVMSLDFEVTRYSYVASFHMYQS